MTKDYAKNKPKFSYKRYNHYRHPNQLTTGLPSWAWVLLGLFFGIALSSFLFWKLSPRTHTVIAAASSRAAPPSVLQSDALDDAKTAALNKTRSKKNKTTKPAQSQTQTDDLSVIQSKESSESRFDFYTLLPTMSVDPLASENLANSKKNTIPYILQAGSFKTHEQAEHLKAVLALQGVEAHIQTVRVNPSESWYRVYIGPFNTKADALEAQQDLDNGQLPYLDRSNSVILKMRVS